MDAFVDLDLEIAGLDAGFDGFGNLDSFLSIGDYDSFLTSFDNFFSDGFGTIDDFYDEPDLGLFPDLGDWLRDFINDIILSYDDSGGDGQIDEIIVTGVINNSDGSFSLSIGSSTISAAVTGLDAGDMCNANTVFGVATSAYALYGALFLAAGPVGFGAYFALGMVGLFFASANHATCST